MKFEYKDYKGKRRIRTVEPSSIEFGSTPRHNQDTWVLNAYDPEHKIKEKFVIENIQRFCKKDEVQRIMCVTVFIADEHNKFFLMHHKKFNKWLAPGGKIEHNETPPQAAIREAYEETGLTIHLINHLKSPSNILAPYGVLLNPIVPSEIEHVDWVYLARAERTQVNLDPSEGAYFGWFTAKEVQELDTFESIKEWCLFFQNILLNEKYK